MSAPQVCIVWPAGTDWLDDPRRLKHPSIARLFEYLSKCLDFTQVREKKVEVMARETGMDAEDVSKRLRKLVEWGYVIEHGRGERSEWRLSLAWSIDEEVSQM